jgi:hypothetical protein
LSHHFPYSLSASAAMAILWRSAPRWMARTNNASCTISGKVAVSHWLYKVMSLQSSASDLLQSTTAKIPKVRELELAIRYNPAR